jgi:hypothetical protein
MGLVCLRDCAAAVANASLGTRISGTPSPEHGSCHSAMEITYIQCNVLTSSMCVPQRKQFHMCGTKGALKARSETR